jgi:hypothetical protein
VLVAALWLVLVPQATHAQVGQATPAGGNFVKKSGDTMTGRLNFGSVSPYLCSANANAAYRWTRSGTATALIYNAGGTCAGGGTEGTALTVDYTTAMITSGSLASPQAIRALSYTSTGLATGSLFTCNGSTTGILIFDTTESRFKFCNGTAWAPFTGAGAAYATVLDETSSVTQRGTIAFQGAGVSCADNAGAARTDCTIAGFTQPTTLRFKGSVAGYCDGCTDDTGFASADVVSSGTGVHCYLKAITTGGTLTGTHEVSLVLSGTGTVLTTAISNTVGTEISADVADLVFTAGSDKLTLVRASAGGSTGTPQFNVNVVCNMEQI